jgi:Single-stranded DNA binding protein Ssb-like, OB fold
MSGFFKKETTLLLETFPFRDCSGNKKMGMRKLNQKKPTIIEHLAFLSVKYSVPLSELFDALVIARELGKATCENLSVEHRGNLCQEEIFLITKDSNVVVQFRIAKEYLLRKDLRIESWMNTDRIQKQLVKQKCGPNISTMIQDLRHGMKKINVEAEVLENSKPSLVHTRYGNRAMVANAWIADETGKVKLCLWNEQAKYITMGDIIQIKNASVTAFKGERQLCLGKTGTITVLANKAGRTKQQSEAIVENTIYA